MTLLPALLRVLLQMQPGRLPDAESKRVRDALSLRLPAEDRVALEAVERYRAELAEDPARVEVHDYGAGSRMVTAPHVSGKPDVRIVSEIYRTAAVPDGWGRVLYRLVRALKPARILELGTSLGVSAAYLRTALDRNHGEGGSAGQLVTIEGAPALAARARAGLSSLRIGPVTVVEGPFAEQLPGVLAAHGPFDAVFLDGHHEARAVSAYFDLLMPHLAPGGWVVFDDIEPWTSTVRRAWRQIRADHPEAGFVDFIKMGLYFHPASR